jgi:hypothetical protein
MAELNVQNLNQGGVDPSYSSADSLGDYFKNNDNTFIHVNNGSAASIDVIVDSQKPCEYGFDHDLTVSIAAGADKMIGPFNRKRFNDENGNAQVNYSDVTSVTVAAISL